MKTQQVLEAESIIVVLSICMVEAFPVIMPKMAEVESATDIVGFLTFQEEK